MNEYNKKILKEYEKKKIVIALSGGVDSAVSAYLLKKEGYQVTAIFMQNWDDVLNEEKKISNCTQEKDWKEAKAVAEQLNIPIFKISFVKEYWNNVFLNFLKQLKKGLTPNPDVLCNKTIKFSCFLRYIKKQFQINSLATGHYANIIFYQNNYFLTKAKDKKKDQTYFLCQINIKVLKHLVFPIAELTKEEVRELARKIELSNAEKKDSTGICFIGVKQKNYQQFLSNYLPIKNGEIKNFFSRITIGQHQGIHQFTIGQRRGLNLETEKNKTHFVVGKDVKKNIIYVVNDLQKEQLFSQWCIVCQFNWLISKELYWKTEKSQNIVAKFRHQQKEIKVKIINVEKWKKIKIVFQEKQEAITPGQYAVLYEKNICLGGGIIQKTEKNNRFVLPL